MAFLNDITFTGKLGDLVAYKVKGSNKIVLRRKGGPSKDAVENSPTFALNRLHRKEFGAGATLGKYIRYMLGAHRSLSNYNITAKLNNILKHLKQQDTEGQLGKRALRLSSIPTLLHGFPVSVRHNIFDSILRTTMRWSLSRDTRSARIDVPALTRQINFFPGNEQPYFCVSAVLGIVPDVLFNEAKGAYGPPEWFDGMYVPVTMSSPWYPVKEGAPPITLEISTDMAPPDDSYVVMLSVGVRFGALYSNDKVELLENLGAAKILGTI